MILEESETFVVREPLIDGCLLHVWSGGCGWTGEMTTEHGDPMPYWTGIFDTKLDTIEAFFRHRPHARLERRRP